MPGGDKTGTGKSEFEKIVQQISGSGSPINSQEQHHSQAQKFMTVDPSVIHMASANPLSVDGGSKHDQGRNQFNFSDINNSHENLHSSNLIKNYVVNTKDVPKKFTQSMTNNLMRSKFLSVKDKVRINEVKEQKVLATELSK